ncbi:MAG: cupin domain-containing protein [Bacteroidota bacterium]|nr:cupin domain-containing protein [Bacteroidota bacterium]
MKYPPLTVIDIQQEQKAETNGYTNFPLSLVNDHVVRMSIMEEPFYWHYHPNSDEVFLVIEGVLIIELETQTVELSAGQLFTIPAGVKHRTRPRGTRSINLTFEKSAMETVKIP